MAALVLACGIGSAWQLHGHAAEVDAATARRSEQLERLAELSQATALPDRGAHAVAGLFPGHEVVVARAPWGPHLALRCDAREELR